MQIDITHFIENYIIVNGEHIILHDYQKRFIKWLNKCKKNMTYDYRTIN